MKASIFVLVGALPRLCRCVLLHSAAAPSRFHRSFQVSINIGLGCGRAGQVRDRNVGWWRWYAGDGRSFSWGWWHAPSRGFVPRRDNTLISRFLVLVGRAGVLVIRTDKC